MNANRCAAIVAAVRRDWSAFGQRHGGTWNVYLDNRSGMPSLVSGRGIQLLSADEFGDATLNEVEGAVRSFLVAHDELLGDWTEYLELDNEASVKLREGHWQLVFRQQMDGVRVDNARLDFHVNRGRLTMFGASNWSVPTVGGMPAIDVADARNILDAYLHATTSA